MKPFLFRMLILFAAALAVALLLAAYLTLRRPTSGLPTVTVTIRGAEIEAEVADTVRTRMQGLSGRPSLGAQQGMLFKFTNRGSYGFWMPDMHFPIDIVWIQDGTVRGVTPNVQPEPGKMMVSLPRHYPPEPVDTVLEVNAGTAERYGFQAGDAVEIK